MVTNWSGHWDSIGEEAHYTVSMLKRPMSVNKLVENTPTVFIKRDRLTKRTEAAWEGMVHGFSLGKDNQERDTVEFKFRLDKRIECPPVYLSFPEGWHIDETGDSQLVSLEVQSELFPPFFKTLNETQDWDEFERDCYKLLKLLGIHEIHTFENQRGRPDGWFKLGSMAVQYDATLESNFEDKKRTQFKNFAEQLSSGSLESDDGTTSVRDCSKSVWSVTRGKSRRITRLDSVTVKEVSVMDLMRVYRERVEKNFSEDQLVSALGNLE
jgi:hypothetical protein